MRLQFCHAGFELDFHLERTGVSFYFGETTVADDGPEVVERRGDATSYPINFVRPEIPWDADGPVHQFDPSEDSEDQ